MDTSNNASYNRVHWLVGTPHLVVKASNEKVPRAFINFTSTNFSLIVKTYVGIGTLCLYKTLQLITSFKWGLVHE